MKNLFKSMMAIAVAAMSFTACSNDLTEDVTPSQEFTVQINAVENLSRTHFGDLNEGKYPTLWDATDMIAASLANGNNKASDADPYVSDDSKNASFKVELNTENATAPYVVYAVSPSSAVVSGVHATYKSWNLNIPSSQTPTDTSCDPKAQIVVGQSESSETLPSSVNIEFSHVTAYAKINFTNVALGEAKVESISIEADQYIADRFYHYVAGANVGTTEANSATKIITIDTSELTNELTNVWVALAPTAVSELTFTINTDQGTITKEVTGLNKEFKSGVVATFDVNMNGIELADPVKYELLKDASNLKVGDKVVIAAADSNFAIGTTQNSNNRAQAAITKSADKQTISDPSANVEIFTVEEGTQANTYAFKATTTAGYIFAASSTKNYMRTQETLDANASWTVTVDANGLATIKAQGSYTNNWLRYNPSSSIFSCYGSGQEDVVIYHMEGGGDVEPTPSITADNISDVSAEGVTNATATFTSENLTEAITVTFDDDVVKAAAVTDESTITYTVSENTTEETREGWIKLAANGVEKTITVSQLAPISEPEGETATVIIDLTAQNYANQAVVSQVTANDIISVDFDKGSNSNAPKYYTTGDAVRVYGGNYFTVSSPYIITKVELTFGSSDGSNAITTDCGAYSNGVWNATGSVKSVTFTIGGSTGNRRIQKIAVTYIVDDTIVIQKSQTLTFSQTEVVATLGAPFTAPTLTGAKTTVTYTSSNEAVATVHSATGEVTIHAVGTTEITATAVGTDEFKSAEAKYTLTVNPAPVGGVTTVTKETFSDTSAAMDGVISYACYQGGGTTAPAINNGEIRLYQNSAGQGGGYITITAKEGYTISSVTIGSSMATTVAHTIGDSTTKSATSSLAANGEHTVSDVNSSSISIYCMGTTNKARLYVNYLSVSYKKAE